MAQNIIFDSRTISGFSYYPDYGVYGESISPMPFQLVDGEEYQIEWDTETYTRTAFSFTNPLDGTSCVAVGNKMVYTGQDDGDPFAIVCDTTNDYLHFFSSEIKTEHYVGVYQKAGRNLVLKDHSGINIEGLDSVVEIRVPTDDGDFQSYTLGARVEKTIDLDFSAGNMEVTPENGTVFGKVVIRQPGTLIPDNIAVDVNIAGIVGTNKGSDMAESRIEYTYDENGDIIAAKGIGLTILPKYSFYGMSKLRTVDLSASPNLTKIDYYCCYECSSLKEVILPASIKTIEMYCFYSGTYPETVRFMGDLSQWMSIKRSGAGLGGSATRPTSLYVGGNLVSGIVEIPDEFTVIPNYTFYGISNITGVKFPEGCTEIGSYAFDYCNDITEITIPDTVTKIGSYAFDGCANMTSFAFGSGVTNMGSYVLRGNKLLSSLTIPEGVTMLGDNMCANQCTSLTSVTIPSTVKSIGQYAFSGASNLTSAKFMDTSGWYCSTTSGATSGTSLTLTNTATAASNLKTKYRNYYWYDAT